MPGMMCPLVEENNAGNDEWEQRSRCRAAAQCEAAGAERLAKKVTHDGTQWPGQDEICPENQRSGELRSVISQRDQSQKCTEDQRATSVSDGFPQRGGGDFDDPEEQGDLRHLA
jgi:hypothetical protein